MNTTGWIKIHRKLLEWEWYTDTKTTRVFLHLLLSANFEDKRFHGKEVKRGQVIIGRHSLADALGLSEQSVRTAIKHLISTNEITIETTNKFGIVTICNYESYQYVENKTNQQNNQQLTNNQPTTNQQLTTTKEYKEIENKRIEEVGVCVQTAPTFLEIEQYAKERNYELQDYESFYNHYSAQDWFTGNGVKITNWKPKLDGWCRENSFKRTTEKLKHETWQEKALREHEERERMKAEQNQGII